MGGGGGSQPGSINGAGNNNKLSIICNVDPAETPFAGVADRRIMHCPRTRLQSGGRVASRRQRRQRAGGAVGLHLRAPGSRGARPRCGRTGCCRAATCSTQSAVGRDGWRGGAGGGTGEGRAAEGHGVGAPAAHVQPDHARPRRVADGEAAAGPARARVSAVLAAPRPPWSTLLTYEISYLLTFT